MEKKNELLIKISAVLSVILIAFVMFVTCITNIEQTFIMLFNGRLLNAALDLLTAFVCGATVWAGFVTRKHEDNFYALTKECIKNCIEVEKQEEIKKPKRRVRRKKEAD